MMSTAKRSYSPTIEDIRQYNIKRQRILNDFETLSLSQQHQQVPTTPSSTRHTEYIPDIEEFLVNNQDDQDILDASRNIVDLNTEDREKWIIPTSIVKIPGVTSKQAEFSYDRLQSRKKFELRFNKFHTGDYRNSSMQNITNDEILYDYEVLKYWSLVKFVRDPWSLVYQVWEMWYFNVYKLHELGEVLDSGRIEMLPDDYSGVVDLSNKEAVVVDNDNDLMINEGEDYDSDSFDDDPGYSSEKMLNNYGSYYGNSSMDHGNPNLTAPDDEDAMDIDID